MLCTGTGTGTGTGVVAARALRTPDGGPRLQVRRPHRASMVTQDAVDPARVLGVLG